MKELYDKGIAFICEGDTEKVFYLSILNYYCEKYPFFKLLKEFKNGNIFYILECEDIKILIMMNNVGTISQITNSGHWFNNSCKKVHNKMPWIVFLCYDTDDYNEDISKFHQGDWKLLRDSIASRTTQIIDLAANADIEDILLFDFDGICKFLNAPSSIIPHGRKGKTKMKSIFRQCNCTYHEGDRAKALIDFLDKKKIIKNCTIPISEIESICFK